MVMTNPDASPALRCSFHGNSESCPGPHQCSGYLHGVAATPAPDAPDAEPSADASAREDDAADIELALTVLANARTVYGADFMLWASRLAETASVKRERAYDDARSMLSAPGAPTFASDEERHDGAKRLADAILQGKSGH